MQSSLIPERPLIISPTLAATIGLEEAVLLHVLSELMVHRACETRHGLQWLELDQQALLDALPFWAWIDVKRVQKNLQDLGLIVIDANTGAQDSWLFAINQRAGAQQPVHAPAQDAVQVPDLPAGRDYDRGPGYAPGHTPDPPRSQAQRPVQMQQPRSAAARSNQGTAAYISNDWQPDDEWLSLCRQHGVPDAFALSLVPGFVMYWRDRAQSRFSWGNAFYKHVLREWRMEQTRRGSVELDSPMSASWLPSADAVSILRNAGVSQTFIDDAVPEFVLYWRERGAQNGGQAGAWNTKFIEHIRRQWARYQVSVVNDGVPRPIPESWQPSQDVFEVLRLAEIDEEFARARVPEFVLYWRDTGQPQASWNTRFLQFVKHTWARRPEAINTGLVGTHGKDQFAVERGKQGLEATFKRFTDRSWAE
ncbi:MAG: DnaT-like ssDNA-binding domain-containing protein [Pseudohongiella sp.]|nr:DnaT-like ssDNA-binding domain-containing protein [Pseudohongiella sp.]MDO9518934.1 DnaT-like ssDNA-binding domain-containing protein [Pseudohongiella sp.]MDP2125751.1 DnaT-like ssDNA-binding domain-containing protein [Pseudohongiella sp.]